MTDPNGIHIQLDQADYSSRRSEDHSLIPDMHLFLFNMSEG